MAGRSFDLIYASEVRKQLDFIDRKFWGLIRENIEEQLRYEPDRETRNRKPLRKPPIDGRWEIRFGPGNSIRVFYEIDRDAGKVFILAIGRKDNERLFIGGKEVL